MMPAHKATRLWTLGYIHARRAARHWPIQFRPFKVTIDEMDSRDFETGFIAGSRAERDKENRKRTP